MEEPTQKDCPIGKTYAGFAIISGSLLVVLFVVIAIICISNCIYKAFRAYLRYQTRQKMTRGERKRIEEDYKEMLNILKGIDPKKEKVLVKEIEKALTLYRGRIRGDSVTSSSVENSE